jgi:hypothetical protein
LRERHHAGLARVGGVDTTVDFLSNLSNLREVKYTATVELGKPRSVAVTLT